VCNNPFGANGVNVHFIRPQTISKFIKCEDEISKRFENELGKIGIGLLAELNHETNLSRRCFKKFFLLDNFAK